MCVTVKLDLSRLPKLPPIIEIVVVAPRTDDRRRVAEALAVPTQGSWGSSSLRDGQELQARRRDRIDRTLDLDAPQPIVPVLGRWW